MCVENLNINAKKNLVASLILFYRGIASLFIEVRFVWSASKVVSLRPTSLPRFAWLTS